MKKKLDDHTTEELVAMRRAVEDDPANRNPTESIFIYTPKAMKKLRAIDDAITRKVAERRAAAGNPVPTSGYSGRQTNRRR